MSRSDDLRFRAGDLSLAATLTLPDGDGRLPWALLVGSGCRAIATAAGTAAAIRPGSRRRAGTSRRASSPAWPTRSPTTGVASLRYDPRGCGESDGDVGGDRPVHPHRRRARRDRRHALAARARPAPHGDRRPRRGRGIALSVAIGDPAIGAVGLIGASARSFRDVLRRGVAERSRTGTDREHPVVAALDRGDRGADRARRAARGEHGRSRSATTASVWRWRPGSRRSIRPPLALATHAAPQRRARPRHRRRLGRCRRVAPAGRRAAEAGNEPGAPARRRRRPRPGRGGRRRHRRIRRRARGADGAARAAAGAGGDRGDGLASG